MASSLAEELDGAGQYVIYYIVGLIVQTFFFGAYSIIMFLSTRMLLERKLKTRVNCVMFGITTFMYLLSTAYWIYSVADGVDRMNGLIALGKDPSLPQYPHTEVTKWSPLFNALVLINYCISDGVVVWRAWVICLRNHRKYLWITIFFLAVTIITVALTIAFRIAGTIVSPIANLTDGSFLKRGIDTLQVTTLFSSLVSNLTATGVVSATAWRHYRFIRMAFSESKGTSTRANRVLLLVVESGVLYCIAALIALFSSLIHLPQGTLNDLYTPINIQLAGVYPSIVLLLVSTQKSLNESVFGEDSSSSSSAYASKSPRPKYFTSPGTSVNPGTSVSSTLRAGGMSFAPPSALSQSSLGSRTDSMILDISSEEKDRRPRLSDVV